MIMDEGLGKRLLEFAVRAVKYCRKLPMGKEYQIITYQLIKSSTSSGANYEEAQGAISKPDFFNKINISLKEMRETNYRLRIIKEIKAIDDEIEYLLKESLELMRILGAISSKSTKRNS
jgi:four helix bundle protein